MNETRPPWSEDQDIRLRALWAAGHSGSEIGRTLRKTTNAVVGRAHRLGLPPRASPIKRSGYEARPDRLRNADRKALLQQLYPAGCALRDIMFALNALPGKRYDHTQQVSVWAAELQLRRPDAMPLTDLAEATERCLTVQMYSAPPDDGHDADLIMAPVHTHTRDGSVSIATFDMARIEGATMMPAVAWDDVRYWLGENKTTIAQIAPTAFQDLMAARRKSDVMTHVNAVRGMLGLTQWRLDAARLVRDHLPAARVGGREA